MSLDWISSGWMPLGWIPLDWLLLAECRWAECRWTDCCWLNAVGLNVIGLNAIGLNVVGLNVIGWMSLAECRWLNAVGLNAIGLNVIGLNVVGSMSLAECRWAECRGTSGDSFHLPSRLPSGETSTRRMPRSPRCHMTSTTSRWTTSSNFFCPRWLCWEKARVFAPAKFFSGLSNIFGKTLEVEGRFLNSQNKTFQGQTL